MKIKKYDKLIVKWSKKENDFLITYPRKCDGSLINSHIFNDRLNWKQEKEKSLIEELEDRGYDLKTLKFEIKLLGEMTPLQKVVKEKIEQ